MSETTSAPAPAAAPPPPPLVESKPPPNTLPPITPSEAGRLLAAQRRANGQAINSPVNSPVNSPGAINSPINSPGAINTPAAPPPAAVTGLSAIERALGAPEGTLAAEPPPAASQPGTAPMDGVEVAGRRYSLAELQNAVERSDDYTRKTQALAAERNELKQRYDALAAVIPAIQPELERLRATIEYAPPKPPAELAATDPERYNRERAAWEQSQDDQQRLAQLGQIQQEAQQRAFATAVAEANEKLSTELPFWADETGRATAQKFIVDWARQNGFSDPELRNMASAHHLKALLKAASFDRMISQSRSTAPALPAVARGMAPPPAPTERVARAETAFQNKLDWRTGASLIAARRANGGG